MHVVRLPRLLRAALFVLFLLIPLAGVEALMVSHAVGWERSSSWVALWSGVAALISIPLSILLARGRQWGLGILTLLRLACVAASGILAVRFKLTSLGFFTIFLVGYFTWIMVWIRREMRRSYFDPQIRWFEGLPQAVPGLICYVGNGALQHPFRVSRMDEEGVFLFLNQIPRSFEWKSLLLGREKELVFVFRDREFRCQGILVGILNRGTERGGIGGGFQFRGLSPDQSKDLGSFVENLRGEGYVA